jgi:hypothetical protein
VKDIELAGGDSHARGYRYFKEGRTRPYALAVRTASYLRESNNLDTGNRSQHQTAFRLFGASSASVSISLATGFRRVSFLPDTITITACLALSIETIFQKTPKYPKTSFYQQKDWK